MISKFTYASDAIKEAEFRARTEGPMQIFEHSQMYAVAPFRASRCNVLETVRLNKGNRK